MLEFCLHGILGYQTHYPFLINRGPEPEERAQFQPAAGDSVYEATLPTTIRIWYTDNPRNRTVYGDIAYAKSCYGFKHPHGQSSIYVTWREQIMAHMIARHLVPGRLTETQVVSILLFARGLLPVKERIELIQCQHHADDLLELNRHLKILVRDSGKKLQTPKEPQRAGSDGRDDVTEPASKC